MTRRITLVPEQRRPPVRVRLRRITAEQSKPYPPDGQGKNWWERLKKAFGTVSSDFVNASLFQLQSAARLNCSRSYGISMTDVLAQIEEAATEDGLAGGVGLHIGYTLSSALGVQARFGSG